MTITVYTNETKEEAKKRYFNEIIQSKESLITKAIDRYMNLSTSAGIMPVESIKKNVQETYELLLPVLKIAKEQYPELADILFVLRTNLMHMSNTLFVIYS